MTEPNVPLLLKTLHHIENHPEEWMQEAWFCGTTACFAGRAARLDGAEQADEEDVYLAGRPDDPDDAFRKHGAVLGEIHVADRAQHILGLTGEQADRLFAPGNTLDDLRAEVYRLVGDWDRLAEVAENAATAAINGQPYTPSAYADPAYDLDTKHLLWIDLMDAIREWDAAQRGEDDLASLEPEWRDGERWANRKRDLVVDAVHKLIGRP